MGRDHTPSVGGGTGEVIERGNTHRHIRPVSDDIDRILNILPGENAHLMRALNAYRTVCEQTGRSDIRFMGADHQGAVSTAATIMDQSALLIAMMTDPDKVHRFLDRVCEMSISFTKRLIEGAGRLDGNSRPPIWLPHTVRITVVEDVMPIDTGR